MIVTLTVQVHQSLILGANVKNSVILKRSREGGGFVSKHLGNPLGDPGNPLLFTGRSDPLIS